MNPLSAIRRSIAVFAACAILPLAAQNALAPRQKALVDEVVESQASHAKVALLVAVGDYDADTTGLPALKYPLSDIADIAKELKLQGYFIATLKERQATAAAVRQQLIDLAAIVEPNQGSMLFYFSGHGFRVGDENFLATYGTTAADMAQLGLSVSEVEKLLAASGARQRIAFIDACRNNPGGKSASAGRPFETLKAAEGLRVLYSTAPGKVSYEDDALAHGVFSYYVAKGLRGEAASADGFITFNDLHSYLTRQMGEYSVKTLRVQMPYQLGESSGDFLLAKGVAPEVHSAVEPVVVASGGETEKGADSPARTQQAADAADAADADPPSRVARLNHTDGDVSLQPAGVEDWTEAMVNRPITTGDKLFVDGDAHAELQIGNASIRLARQAGFSFLNLNDRTAQMQLTQGVLSIKVKRLTIGEVIEVDTPNSAARLLGAGDYRFEVSPQGDSTDITVRQGQAEVTTASGARTLRANESARLVGLETPVFEMAARQRQPDDLDRWAAARDRRQESPVASRYVPDDMVGAEDLDQHGQWQAVQGQGMAWAPTSVSAGWAPYRDGQWAWVDPWGWTWVDAAPWGFAPFHYGRWMIVGGRWMWFPGGAGPRPVYSPAMVGWAGMPPRAGLSIGVGWFPLGPREVYVPPYRTSRYYAGRMNVTNVNITRVNVTNVNVTNVTYVNRSQTTVVTREAFAGGRPVRRNLVAVNQADLSRATYTQASGVAPERASVIGGGRARVVPPEHVMARRVMAQGAPPPPRPAFARQEAMLREGGGRPLAGAQRASLQANAPAPNVRRVSARPAETAAVRQPAPPQRQLPVQRANQKPDKNQQGAERKRMENEAKARKQQEQRDRKVAQERQKNEGKLKQQQEKVRKQQEQKAKTQKPPKQQQAAKPPKNDNAARQRQQEQQRQREQKQRPAAAPPQRQTQTQTQTQTDQAKQRELQRQTQTQTEQNRQREQQRQQELRRQRESQQARPPVQQQQQQAPPPRRTPPPAAAPAPARQAPAPAPAPAKKAEPAKKIPPKPEPK